MELHEKIIRYKINFGLLQEQECSIMEKEDFESLLKNKQSLPKNVRHFINGEKQSVFYKLQETDLSEDEINKYLLLKQLMYLKSINNGIKFFVTLSIIFIIVMIILIFV